MIYAALNPVTKDLTKSINQFNGLHQDEQIRVEIRDYSDEGGIERLLTELVLGQAPDIMEMHRDGEAGSTPSTSYVVPETYTDSETEYWMPYRQMAQKGYLEDLWPYIENDPELGREALLKPPLEAAGVNGGLYILFRKVAIFSLTGRESVVGDRYSWTLEELMETFSGMPEGSTILRYNMTKQDVFFNLLRFSLARYVDRESGACYFDGQEFRELVGFLESFPDEVGYENPRDADEEIMRSIQYGRQMLEGAMLIWPRDICFADAVWQERAAFPGYPTADGSSGNFFYPAGNILAMSSTCQNKDAAWAFIYREMLRPRLTQATALKAFSFIPINLHDYEMLVWGELKESERVTRTFRNPTTHFERRKHFPYGPEIQVLHLLTEEDTQRYWELINHTTQLYWPDDDLTDIVWDVLGAYFAGDRTLDQTVQMLNNRVGLYLKEAM